MVPLAEEIRAALEDLVAGLPEGSASVRAEDGRDITTLRVDPSSPTAAPVSVIVPHLGGGVTLQAGKGTIFEIPPAGRRYTGLPLLEELKSICSAVLGGGLEESVVFAGSEVVKAVGSVRLQRPVTVRWRRAFVNPFKHRKEELLRYEPYSGVGR